MRIKLTSELEAYCAEHKIRVTDGMELDDAQLEKAREMWSRQHPDKDAAEIEIHAIGLVAAQIKPDIGRVDEPFRAPVATVRDWKEIAWKIAVLILLLLITIRGHAQIDVIKVQDNAGAAVGTIAAPFTFKAGANCTWAKSASTYTFNCAGGAAGAGGLNTQVQWNSTGSLAGISSLTTDGTVNTALAGADWLFADLTTPTKKFQFDASNISAATTRTMNVPDANATFAQAIAAVSHKFITQMSAQGLFTLAQPACADISDAGAFCNGTAYSSLTGTPTLPVTIANVSHKWLNTYTSGTGAFTQTQPDYSDLTGTPTLPANTTATASNFFTAYNSSTGAFTKAQPAFSDVSGTLALASAVFANQGTTTTVLHGNAAGNPSFASVSISADVSGLGTGVATFLGTPSSANFFSAITDEIGNGSKAVKMDSVTGNGTAIATGTGTYTSGNCVKIDANGNLVDNGSACGGGSGATATSWSGIGLRWNQDQMNATPTAQHIYCDGQLMVPTVTASNITVGGWNAGATATDVGIYAGTAGGTCTLQAHTGAVVWNTGSQVTKALTGAPKTITPVNGRVYVCSIVDTAGTQTFSGDANSQFTFYSMQDIGTTGTAGTLPATTTCPADSAGHTHMAVEVH